MAREKNKVKEQNWEMVLADARTKRNEALARAKELAGVIKYLEAKVRSGEPFPGRCGKEG